jgi:hypothetical protein
MIHTKILNLQHAEIHCLIRVKERTIYLYLYTLFCIDNARILPGQKSYEATLFAMRIEKNESEPACKVFSAGRQADGGVHSQVYSSSQLHH